MTIYIVLYNKGIQIINISLCRVEMISIQIFHLCDKLLLENGFFITKHYQLPTYLCTYPYTFTLEIVTETDNREKQGALSRNSNYSCFQSDRPRSCIEKQRGCSASTVLYPLQKAFLAFLLWCNSIKMPQSRHW